MICISFQIYNMYVDVSLYIVEVKKIVVLRFSKLSFTVASAYILPQNISDMLNKNTLGVKKCEANQKQHASWQVRPRSYFIKNTFLLIE